MWYNNCLLHVLVWRFRSFKEFSKTETIKYLIFYSKLFKILKHVYLFARMTKNMYLKLKDNKADFFEVYCFCGKCTEHKMYSKGIYQEILFTLFKRTLLRKITVFVFINSFPQEYFLPCYRRTCFKKLR